MRSTGIAAVLGLLSAAAAAAAEPLPRHVIYLHGRIVQEQQSARPTHPRLGAYELEEILEAFRRRGFVVEGGIRPRSASVSESAEAVVSRVRELLVSGVPPGRITIVGASMGGSIALLASARLQNPRLRFCVLGVCLSDRRVAGDEGSCPAGRVLAIRERSDELTASCVPWDVVCGDPARSSIREIVVETGLAHGFLYRPLPQWLDPVVAWAEQRHQGDE